ncbi:uncharacterized protein BDZ99DRAFT_499772 [Mytilinidion resinicola]|uniref:DUF7905 domain-containing protein n=1 Tax=Mytilinidion resinicola TaxID=574789 RepID=A0A6A6YIT3_9PEZI|nr:uncharacterized protein BDZ99DRAFT_499772 [Mytilinidion resinicola]KAF2808458.1 hypothetical protein BDZ99DRAFT_499772 [Mytilinidion resinicola]
MEELRKIQVGSMVYTSLQSAGPGMPVRIMITGTEQARVDDAKPRVENFIKAKIALQNFRPTTRFVCFEERIKSVRIKPYGNPQALTVIVDPMETLLPVEMVAPLRQPDIQEMIRDDQLEAVEETILESFDVIRQRSQVYSMGISLGLLKLGPRLRPSQENCYKRDEFVDMMERDDTRVSGSIEKPVMGSVEHELLGRLIGAPNVLSPIHHQIRSNSFIKPVFRVTAILRDPNNSGRNVLLQLEFEDRDDDEIVRLPAKWSILEPGKDLPANMMNVNLLFPSSGRAWHFHVNSSRVVRKDRLSPFLVEYANRIVLDTSRARNPNFLDRYIRFPTGGPTLLRAKTERVWVFRITGTDYRLEASQSRYGYDANPHPTLQWFCTVRHPDWETHFHMLEKMTIGNVPKWPHMMKMFFPDDGYTYIEETEPVVEPKKKKEIDKAAKKAKIGGENFGKGKGKAKDIDTNESSKKMSIADSNNLKPETGLRLLTHKLIKITAVVEGRPVE